MIENDIFDELDEEQGQVALQVAEAAQRYGVDPTIALGVAFQESRLGQRRVSPAGAVGVMQLMEGTAGDLGVTDREDDAQNIDGGVRYLKQLLDRYGGDTDRALAAYNAGMGRVDRMGLDGVLEKYSETRDYLPKVKGHSERFNLSILDAMGSVTPSGSPDSFRPLSLPSLGSTPKSSMDGFYSIRLPDGSQVPVASGISEEDAFARARKLYPEAFEFEAIRSRSAKDDDSSPLDAFLSTAARTTTGLFPGLKAAFASAIGDEEMYDSAQRDIEEASLLAADIAPSLTSTSDISDLWKKGEYAAAVGKAFEFGTETIGSSFGYQVPAAIGALGGYGLAAAGLAGGIAAPVLATLGGLGAMYATFLSSDIERARQEGAEDTDDVELLKIMAAAGGQTALNSLSYLMLGGGSAVKGVLGAGLSKEGKDIALTSFGKMLNKLDNIHPVKQAAAILLEEEVAEVGQQALERMAAGLPVSPSDEQARDEYVQVMLATLAPGVGFGAGRAGVTAFNTANQRNEEGYATKLKALSGESGQIAQENYEKARRDSAQSFQDLADSINEETNRLSSLEEDREGEIASRYVLEAEKAAAKLKSDVAAGRATQKRINEVSRQITSAKAAEYESYVKRIAARDALVAELSSQIEGANAAERSRIESEIDSRNREIEKIRLEMEAAQAAEEVLASGATEERKQAARDRVSRLREVTREDITQTLESRNISYDNDPSFMVWMSQLRGPDGSRIGKYEIDALDADQRRHLLEVVESLPVQEESAQFYGASPESAELIFRQAVENQRNPSSPVKIAKLLNLPSRIDASTRKGIAENYFRRMRDMGLVEKRGDNYYAKTELSPALEEQYAKVAALARNGNFPSVETVVEQTDISDPDVIEELRLAFIAREGVGYTPREFSKEFRLSIDGEVDQTRSFPTLAEAQAAANAEVSSGTKSVEVLDLEERLRVPEQLRQPVPERQVEIVERDAPFSGVSRSEYNVSSKPSGAWEVLDSSGNRVALRSSKNKAQSFVNGTGSGRVDVIVNGQRIGSARNRPKAQKLRADWIGNRRAEAYDAAYQAEMAQTENLDTSVYTRDARAIRAEKAAKKAASEVDARYKTKYEFVPHDFSINKVDGFTVTERRVGDDGRQSNPRITEVFSSREEADSYVADSLAAVSGPTFFEGQEVTRPSLLRQLESSRSDPESATARRLRSVREVEERPTRPFPAEEIPVTSDLQAAREFPAEAVPEVGREAVAPFPAEEISLEDARALAVAEEVAGQTSRETGARVVREAAERTLEQTGESPIGPFGIGAKDSEAERDARGKWRQARLRPEAERSVISRLDRLVEGVESGEIELDPESEFGKKYEQQKLSEENKNILLKEAAIDSPGDRAEWIANLDKEVQAISSRMGLPVKVKLYEKKGAQESAAEFLTESMVIQIAVDADLEGKTTQEQLAAIEPFLNHEFIHVSRRLGLIKASEWSKLTDYVEKTPIPDGVLSEINAAQRAAGGETFPEGTTYLDYAFKAYGAQGTHQADAARDKAAFDNGEITAKQYEAVRAERAKRNWIRDDYVEEAVARLFQDYTAQGQINLPDANRAAPEVEKGVFKRILNWFRQVGNAISKRGNPSVADIMSTFAAEGELKKRLDRGKALDTWWLRRVDSAEYERLRGVALATGNKFPDPQTVDRLVGEQAKAEGEKESAVNPEGRSAQEFAVAWVSDESKTSPETRRAIDVFHGTPYIWRENPRLGRLAPDLHRVGTGEGPQAFSWGFYTAESPDVAEGYRRRLSSRMGTDGGSVYGLTIDESERSLLDLDRSVSEQSTEVQRVLLEMGLIQEGDNLDALNGQDMYVRLVNQFQSPVDAEFSGDLIGESEASMETLQAASETMLEAGIPGVRFLDGKSRPKEATTDTHNYVMFSDENIYVDPVRTDPALTEGAEIGSPGRTVNEPVLAPASADPRNLRVSGEVGDLDSYTWGDFSFNRFGNSSAPARVIVKEGYATRNPGTGELSGMGKRFLESSTGDVQRNTTFSNWEDLVTGAFQRINPQLIKSGEFTVTSPTQDEVVLVWNDPRFENPVAITLDYVKDSNSDVSGNPDNDYWSVVGVRADGRYSLPAKPYQAEPSLRGPDVSASAVVAAERPDLVEPATNSEIRRYSLESSTESHTPETEKALDTIRGDLPRPKKSLWQLATSGLPEISNDTLDRLRQLFFDKYNRIWKAGLLLGDRGDIVQLADSSAHAAALQVDRASAFFARMLIRGGIEFQTPTDPTQGREFDGTPVVTALPLVNEARGVVVGFNPEDLNDRRTIDVSLPASQGYKTETGGLIPILQLIANPAKNLTDEFFQYARALRALRLKAEGRASGKDWSDEEIARVLALAEAHPEIGVVHRNLQNWNNKLVDFLQATQAIPSWMAEEWKKYGDYTPFYRDLSNMNDAGAGDTLLLSLFGSEFDNQTTQAIANSLVTGEPSKKLKNATGMDQMMSPIEAISKNAMRLITVGLKNNARNRAIRDQEILGAINLGEGESNTLARKLEEGDNFEGSVITLRNGEEERWYIADRMTHEVLQGSFSGNNPGIEGFSRILSIPANVLREGVTRAPDFILRNLQRDSVNAWQLGIDAPDSPGGAPLVGTLARYGRNLRLQFQDKATEEYEALQDFGAIGGYELLGVSPKKLQRIFQSKIEDRTGAKQKLWNIWDKWGEASARSESAVREQVYLQVLRDTKALLQKKGYTDQSEIERIAMSEAAFQAMEVLNFSRRGSSTAMQLFTAGIPFLNARLQGLDRLYRAYVYKESPNSTLSKEDFSRILKQRLLLLSSITAGMAVLNYGDEDYEDLRKEQRDDNWMIMLPKWGPEGSPRFVSIPISFENGILAKVIPEQIARSFMKYFDGKEAGSIASDFGSTMWRQLVATLNINPLGFAAFHPANQALVTNWDNFRNTQIVPQWMKDSLDPEYQRRSTTSSTAQNFRNILDFVSAGFIDLSPIQIEHLIRGYGGTLGMYSLMASDFVADRLLGGIDFPVVGELGKSSSPLMAWSSIPLARTVAKSGIGGGNVQAFYEDIANELNQVVGTLNAIKEEGNPQKYAAYIAENRDILARADAIRLIRKNLKTIRQAKEAVMNRPGDILGKRTELNRLRALERDMIANAGMG